MRWHVVFCTNDGNLMAISANDYLSLADRIKHSITNMMYIWAMTPIGALTCPDTNHIRKLAQICHDEFNRSEI